MAIELLESRIAPAAVISPNGKTATYTDVDGDIVTIAITKGDLHDTILEFEGGQFQLIDFQQRSEFQGTNLSITAKRTGNSGDGLVDVGAIHAFGLNLGNVDVRGDLGHIDAGNVDHPTVGLKSLSVVSLGERGFATLPSDWVTLISTVNGSVGSLNVAESVSEASFSLYKGRLGTVYIGGDLSGGSADYSGSILAEGIGTVKIRGSIIGNDGSGSGRIASTEGIRSVFVGGGVFGGDGGQSGTISVVEKLGSITVGKDLSGGDGALSGRIDVNGAIDSISIHGSISGNAADYTGGIDVRGNVKSLFLGGSLIGGDGKASGSISLAALNNGSIGEDVIGGAGTNSGSISILKSGARSLSIQGNVLGGTGEMSGSIDVRAGKVGDLSIRGDLVGKGTNSGLIRCSDSIGYLYVGGDVIGDGVRSGRIVTTKARYISVNGEIRGGGGEESGLIAVEQLGSVYVGRDVVGGSGVESGLITGSSISEIYIGGSLLGGSARSAGAVFAGNFLAYASIKGDVIGGTATSTGGISAGSVFMVSIGGDLRGPAGYEGTDAIVGSGSIRGSNIGFVYIGGSFIGGSSVNPDVLQRCGAIIADEEIASVRIAGDVKGALGSRFASPALISAEGDIIRTGKPDLAIGEVTVGGRLEGGFIRAGYDENSIAVNADAQIGTISVNEWVASNVVAGVSSGTDGFYGTDDDTRLTGGANRADLVSRIAKVIIRNSVIGTAAEGDSFGIVAEEIGSLWIGTTRVPFTSAANEVQSLARTGDLFAREDV